MSFFDIYGRCQKFPAKIVDEHLKTHAKSADEFHKEYSCFQRTYEVSGNCEHYRNRQIPSNTTNISVYEKCMWMRDSVTHPDAYGDFSLIPFASASSSNRHTILVWLMFFPSSLVPRGVDASFGDILLQDF